MRVVLLVNPVAGRGRAPRLAEDIARELARKGCAVERRLERPASVPEASRSLDGFDAAVVIGGDGTLHGWLPHLLASGVPVWHAPLGTENLFARAHGMSGDPAITARSVQRARTSRRDLGLVNGTPFAIMASFGPDASIVTSVNRNRRRGITHLSYAVPTGRALLKSRVARGRLRIDGHDRGVFSGMIVVAVMREYGAGLDPAWDARHDDNALDVVVVPGARAAAVGLRLMACWTREPLLVPGRRHWRGRTVELCFADPVLEPVDAQVDGDPSPEAVAADGSTRFESLPGALRVVVPAV